MKTLLWLDDYRDPFKDDWLNFSPIGKQVDVVWCKSAREAIKWVDENGLPDAVCFDHDLDDIQYGLEFTGYDFAKWLVGYCMHNELKLPEYASQSANPVGRENILKFLDNYKNKFQS